MICPSEDELLQFVQRQLPAVGAERVAAHLADCASCAALVADGARMLLSTQPEAPGAALDAGAQVARYVILSLVGRGAMGVVYAAYDPQLDRRVALKILRPDVETEKLRERFLGEGRSMARLQHPNVVAVHDVGVLDGAAFLAMEFVDGATLTGWLAERQRTPREILEVFVQAARGLAGAHRAGIVHRDFKPDNVLVGRDGRVRVTDFGLARLDAGELAARGAGAPVSLHATDAGTLLGTPAFMAPEQLRGERAEAAADQFAFAAALYRALFGQAPFPDESFSVLRDAVERGEVRKPRSPPGLPARVTRAVLRALERDPKARFPDMDQLIAALTRDRRRVLGALVATAVVALALGGGVLAWSTRRHACTGAAAAWGDTFGEARQRAVREAFTRSGRPWADDAFTRVAAAVGQYAHAWEHMHTDACEATRVRGEQSEAMLDLRMACLGERRREAAILIELFGEAGPELVDRAATAVEALPSVAECADPRRLTTAELPAAPAAQSKVAALREDLARVRALRIAGRYEEGIALATRALDGARAVGWRPLQPKLLFERGAMESRHAVPPEPDLHEAAALAVELGDDAVAADAWLALLRQVGYERKQPEAAEPFARYAEAAIHRLGDDARESRRLAELAAIRWLRQGRLDEALALCLRARELLSRSSPDDKPWQLTRLDAMQAGLADAMGRIDEAVALFHRASLDTERALGPRHPELSSALANEAEALSHAGRTDEALALYRRARGLLTESHPNLPYLDQNIAATLREKRDFAGALAADRSALDAIVRRWGADSAYLDFPLTGEGEDLLGLGRPKEARAPLERALAMRENGAPPAALAETCFALARALGDSDRPRARALALRARALLAPAATRWRAHDAKAYAEIDEWLEKP